MNFGLASKSASQLDIVRAACYAFSHLHALTVFAHLVKVMMALLNALERTRAEFERIIVAAGFRAEKFIFTRGSTGSKWSTLLCKYGRFLD